MGTNRRTKGDGSIREYKPGKFIGSVEVGYEGAKRIRKAVTGNSEAEVVRKMNKLKGDIARKAVVRLDTQTLSYFMEKRWFPVKETTCKKTTLKGYWYIYNSHIKGVIGGLRLQNLSTQIINDYLMKKLSSGLSACSVAKHKALLHNVLEMAISEKLIHDNVMSRSLPIKKVTPETRALSVDEAKELLREAKGHKGYIYYVILLALNTGMRRGELLALKWKCLGSDTITIYENVVEVAGGAELTTPKTDKSRRTLSVSPSVIEELNELRLPEDEDDDLIFKSTKGKLVIPSNMNAKFYEVLEGLQFKCRFHDLRHTHATVLISNGVDIKTVSERLGHSDIRTTLNKYTHVVSEVDKRASMMINDLLS